MHIAFPPPLDNVLKNESGQTAQDPQRLTDMGTDVVVGCQILPGQGLSDCPVVCPPQEVNSPRKQY